MDAESYKTNWQNWSKVLTEIMISLGVKTFDGDMDDTIRMLTESAEVLPAGSYAAMASQVQNAETRAKAVAEAAAQEVMRIRGIAQREVSDARAMACAILEALPDHDFAYRARRRGEHRAGHHHEADPVQRGGEVYISIASTCGIVYSG